MGKNNNLPCDNMSSLEFMQFNNIRNEFNKILDLVVCNQNDIIIIKTSDPILTDDTYHSTLEI